MIISNFTQDDHQKLAPTHMDEQLPDGPLVVELTHVKCHQRWVIYPGANIQS